MTATLLRKLSITYILLPNLLFSYGWFRQPYSIILITGYLFLLSRELLKNEESERITFKEVRFLIIFALVWTFYSGAGGFSQQKSDFFPHNAKFYDLYKNPWPTYFPEISRYACYYFGYFLVPAFVAKCIGQLHPLLIYIWTAIGYFLGLSWVYLLIGRSKSGLFAFFWFRGVGYILYLLFLKIDLFKLPIYRPVINGLVQQSHYAPNQLIGTLIVTCILIYDFFVRKQIKDTVFPITLIFIWGIFPSISLTVIYAVVWIRYYFYKRHYSQLQSWSLIPTFFIPAILLLPVIGYFLSANNTTVRGFLWQFDSPLRTILYYFLGIGLDLLLYYYLVRSLRLKEKLIPFWFLNSLFTIWVVFSTYRVGFHNDWFYRTQIPIFIVVVIVLIRGFNSYVTLRSFPVSWVNRFSWVFVASMMLLQMTAYVHLFKDNIIVKALYPSATNFKPMPYNRYPNVYQLMKNAYKNRGDAEQYLGDRNSFYEQYLAKKPENKTSPIPN